MKLILRGDDGRERVVADNVTPASLRGGAGDELLDEIHFGLKLLERGLQWVYWTLEDTPGNVG